MPFSEIKKLLHTEIGLHAETVGESSIDRAINHRMMATDCRSDHAYYTLLTEEKAELDELIEEVVVPETWFFRNVTPFEVLRDNAEKIYSEVLKVQATKQREKKSGNEDRGLLRVLSIPCSSGEEPYSIAMALREANLRTKDFMVDAVDVSKRALKKARRAIYGKHSFREPNMGFQDKYFEKIQSGFRLLPTISERVSFHQANILTDNIGPTTAYYDVIFCRNLLIYFDRETQHRILDKLYTLLKPGGLLFMGHAETGQIDKEKFSKIRVAKAFAFRKKIAVRRSVEFPVSANDQSVNKLKDIYDQLVEVTKRDVELAKKINQPKYPLPRESKEKKVDVPFFTKIDVLINSGHLSDAVKLCEELLIGKPENADAYYYLGLISSLQGSQAGAETLLRKAIYLSPDHHKALALSAVLAERRGDEVSAKSLRRREQNARQRNS